MYSRAPAITSKPAITYCCLHARHEVQPINLNGGLLMKWALEKVYKAAKHLNSEINCCLKHKNKGGEALPHRSCGCAHPRQHQISPQPAPCSCCTAPASPPAARCPHLQAFGWQKALSFPDKWKIEAGRGGSHGTAPPSIPHSAGTASPACPAPFPALPAILLQAEMSPDSKKELF